MNVNWDEVAEEASNSPRTILGAALEQADDIVDIVVIYNMRDGVQYTCHKAESHAMLLAMLELCKWSILKQVHEESESD